MTKKESKLREIPSNELTVCGTKTIEIDNPESVTIVTVFN